MLFLWLALVGVGLALVLRMVRTPGRDNDGIIIGASSIGHLTENIGACDSEDVLPDSIVQAFSEAWEVTKPACPKYFRP
jgi:aryl-alcohol dehydrogenase-like predicted oxidoreductase